MLRSHIAVLALLLVPAGALALPTSQEKALDEEVAALKLDLALNLTQQQAKTLLPELQGLKAAIQAKKDAWASSEPARVAALTQAVKDLKATGTVSDSTTQALEAARPAARGAVREDVKAFFGELKTVLRPDQKEALKTAKLFAGQAKGSLEEPMKARGGARHGARRVLHCLLSDDFLSLVQVRAG